MFGASAVRRGSGPQGRRIDQRHTASSRYGQTAAFETTDHGNVRHNSLHSVGSPTPSDAGCRGSRRASALRPGETAEQARLRRIEERDRLNKGVVELKAAEQYDAELQTNQLVVLYVDSLDHATVDPTKPPPDFEWKLEREAYEKRARDSVIGLRGKMQRIARECPDVKFLRIDADAPGGKDLAGWLGFDTLPALVFVRASRVLLMHCGVVNLEQCLGEGVLYYGDTAAEGVHASDYVQQLSSTADLQKLMGGQDPKVLTVVNVALNREAPGCVRVYPAVLALARSFVGYANFGRLLGDTSAETKQLLQELKVVDVPTFLFYRGGKEVGRYVGSNRSDLVGQIMRHQSAAGVPPPAAPKRAPLPRQQAPTRKEREAAREQLRMARTARPPPPPPPQLPPVAGVPPSNPQQQGSAPPAVTPSAPAFVGNNSSQTLGRQ